MIIAQALVNKYTLFCVKYAYYGDKMQEKDTSVIGASHGIGRYYCQ